MRTTQQRPRDCSEVIQASWQPIRIVSVKSETNVHLVKIGRKKRDDTLTIRIRVMQRVTKVWKESECSFCSGVEVIAPNGIDSELCESRGKHREVNCSIRCCPLSRPVHRQRLESWRNKLPHVLQRVKIELSGRGLVDNGEFQDLHSMRQT